MGIFLSSIEGNRQCLDGGAMFGNAPRAVWEKWCKPDDLGRIELACRCLLVEINEAAANPVANEVKRSVPNTPPVIANEVKRSVPNTLRILCETGIGAFFDPQLKDRYGVTESEHILLSSLEKRSLTHEDIDYVILSHLHFDHAGGILEKFDPLQPSGSLRLLFPNAQFVVGKKAFERAVAPHPRDRASFINGMAQELQKTGRLILVEEGQKNIFPEEVLNSTFSFLFSDGHTPGQMHTRVHSAKTSVIFAGDLVPGTAWVHLPITMGYDRFAELVIDEKKKLYESIANTETYLFYTHDNKVSASKVIHKDSKYIPSDLKPQFDRFLLV